MAKLHERWESKTKELEKTVSYRTESIALDIALQVFDRLRDLNINRKQLADRLNVSRSYVSQILGGKPNLTLQSLVKVADALGAELTIEFRAPSRAIPISVLLGEKTEAELLSVDVFDIFPKPKEHDVGKLQTADDSLCSVLHRELEAVAG